MKAARSIWAFGHSAYILELGGGGGLGLERGGRGGEKPWIKRIIWGVWTMMDRMS